MKKTKFLILRFSSIGDIVLTTPVTRCIKKQYPNAEVHFATKESFKVLVENNPYIDQYHLLGKSLNKFIQSLQTENFDFIIDLHNNLRTSIIKMSLFSVKSFSFDKLNFKKWLLVVLKINQMPNVHIVDRYLETVKSLGIKNDLNGLDFFIPEKDKVQINASYVAYAIGGQHNTKKLPINRIIKVCQKINGKIMILGGKEDRPAAEEIEKALGDKIINACGKYNLNQSASLVQQAEYIITHDTGLMHIASALKKKVISIWGNTVPEFGMYPYLTAFSIIENKEISCRPCSKIGYDKCPKGHFKCMNELNLDF
jgi:ADP-heptose:LPS heptosyltransferase